MFNYDESCCHFLINKVESKNMHFPNKLRANNINYNSFRYKSYILGQEIITQRKCAVCNYKKSNHQILFSSHRRSVFSPTRRRNARRIGHVRFPTTEFSTMTFSVI